MNLNELERLPFTKKQYIETVVRFGGRTPEEAETMFKEHSKMGRIVNVESGLYKWFPYSMKTMEQIAANCQKLPNGILHQIIADDTSSLILKEGAKTELIRRGHPPVFKGFYKD